MKRIAVPKVLEKGESRISLIPGDAKKLIEAGLEVTVESGAGDAIHIPDSRYREAGASVAAGRKQLLNSAEIILSLEKPGDSDIAAIKPGSLFVGILDPLRHPEPVRNMAAAGVSVISLDMIPRSTRAQKMDVLSSQASLAGYAAVLLAAGQLDRIFPMMMTPAGTLKPARVFIIGVGVAGLQAIATAKRLGARVEAFDTRPVVAEEVRSLGAKFVEVDLGETGQTKDGYATKLTDAQLEKQQAAMAGVCAHSDVVITTAQLFGRPAPRIITEEMIQNMMPGSVIVDLAVESGGNVAGSRLNEIVEKNGVHIIGYGNLPGRVPVQASQMLSANLTHFITEFAKNESRSFVLDQEDDIITSSLIAHEGKLLLPQSE